LCLDGYSREMNIYPLIAEKVERDPGVVAGALTTLEKWSAMDVAPAARLAEWRKILKEAQRGRAGRNRLAALLRDNSERSRRLLDFAPFAGVLTREERRKVFLKCRYDH
jgi:hypothetical protein